jgi:hypothetical protein
MRSRRNTLIRPLTLLAMFAVLLGAALPAGAQSTAEASPSVYTRRQRFGIAFAADVWEGDHRISQSISSYNLAALKLGWYTDWRFRDVPPQPKDVNPSTRLEYIQMVEVRDDVWPQDWVALQSAVTLNPGSTWIIGNEPECPNQGNLTPAQYATRYHDVFVRIKGWDPSAQVAFGGVVEPTPLRLRWLDAALTSYQTQFGHPMTNDIDAWTVHMQILTEGPGTAGAGEPVGISVAPGEGMEYSLADCANIEVFKSLIRDLRAWLAGKSEREKPLIISEMGVLMPSYLLCDSPSLSEAQRAEVGNRMIEQFMGQAFDWLLEATSSTTGCSIDNDHLVQRWLWFSLNDSFYDETTNPKGFNGALFDYKTHTLTRFGTRFVAVRTQVYALNLAIVGRR